MPVDQCAILYIEPGARAATHVAELRDLGFSVDVIADLPSSEVFTEYHAIVIRAEPACNLSVLGTRLRAKPRFGRRVLIGLVPDSCTPQQRRDAALCGFDVTLSGGCSTRDLAAHILRRLRPFPEYRCLLRAPNGRRKAA
jgi:hypothetical protein